MSVSGKEGAATFEEQAYRAMSDVFTIQNRNVDRIDISADWQVETERVWGIPIRVDPALPDQTIRAVPSCVAGRHYYSDAPSLMGREGTIPNDGRCLMCGERP